MILCVGYREWAMRIYLKLGAVFPDIVFKISTEFDVEMINSIKPKLILFFGWSDIIPKGIIEKYECLMLHPSPLPKYRGGTPIQNQVIQGEIHSKVTIFRMDDGIDTGLIYKSCYLSLEGNISDILLRIETLGLALTIDILNGDYISKVQNQDDATYFPRLMDNEIHINDVLNKDSTFIYNKIRMLGGDYPYAYLRCGDGKKLLIREAEIE